MAIAYGSAGTRLLVGTAATTWNVPYPATIVSGDLLVLHISSNGGAATSPSGWTVIYNETTLTNPKGGMWIKVATGSESGNLAVTMASSTGNAQMFLYTGVDTTTPQDATATTYSNSVNSNTVIPAITTVTANTMLVYCNSANSSTVTMTAPGTERVDHGALGGTGTKAGALYDEAVAGTGSTGTRTITLSAGRANWGAMIALRPASGGSPVTASPSAISSGETFGSVVVALALTVAPTGIGSAEAFGTPTHAGALTAAPSSIGSGEAFGTPTVSNIFSVNPSSITSAEAFGTPTISTALTASPSGIASAESFGTPTIAGALTVAPTGVGSAESFGTPTVAATLTSSPTGIASGETFGTPTVATSLTAAPAGIATGEAFGTPTAAFSTTATPTGISSGEAFGTPTIAFGYVAIPTGIASAESFGTPVAVIPILVQPVSIGTAELVSNVNAILNLPVTVSGIPSAQAMGTPAVSHHLFVQVPTVQNGETFGTPTVSTTLTAQPAGIPSAQAFGFPSVTYVTTMAPSGIPSAEAVGSPTIILTPFSGRDLTLTAESVDRPYDVKAIAERWDVAGIDRLLTGGVFVPVWAFEAVERPLAASLIEGDVMDRIILKSSGATEYVGGVITETTGKNISAATVQMALGSATVPGTFAAPSTDTSGPVNVRKVTMLVGTTPNTPKGEYWVWVKVTDTPEVTTLRLPQKVIVR